MTRVKCIAAMLFFFSLSTPLFALSLADSVGVENQNGKMIILHKLDPKDNYYSIARRYNVHPKAIMDYNNNAKMQIGVIIKVPTDRPFNTNSTQVKVVIPTNQPNNKTAKSNNHEVITKPETPQNEEYTQYKVSAGETLYAISKRFQVKVDDLIGWNSLKNNTLTPGQLLRIKREEQQPAPAPVITAPVITAPVEKPVVAAQDNTLRKDSARTIASDSSANRRLPNNRYGLTEKNEKGTAVWIDDPNLDAKKKYVLHRTAPVGTIIKITNPNTNRTTFAKVVGSFTDNETNKDAIVVMTKDVAQSLGALDKRFYVSLSYGSPNP